MGETKECPSCKKELIAGKYCPDCGAILVDKLTMEPAEDFENVVAKKAAAIVTELLRKEKEDESNRQAEKTRQATIENKDSKGTEADTGANREQSPFERIFKRRK